MTEIHIQISLLSLFSYIYLVCCGVPQLEIEQNKDVFCLGETARLTCRWDIAPASSWTVNGTVTTIGGLNRMAGHNTSTSLTEGFTRVSITQTQPSVTSYTCIVTIDEDFPSEVVYVTFRGTQCWDFIIFCLLKNVSFFQILSLKYLYRAQRRKALY